MHRPYDPVEGAKVIENETQGRCSDLMFKGESVKKLGAGEWGGWKFATTVPKNYTTKMNLYILGYVTARGILNTPYVTLFARKYDPRLRRFVADEDNPDYGKYE